jgi:hypothetical protein
MLEGKPLRSPYTSESFCLSRGGAKSSVIHRSSAFQDDPQPIPMSHP